MRSIRNLVFAALLGVLLFTNQISASLDPPPEMDCPSGCSCDELGTEVEIECPGAYASSVCHDIADACTSYCAEYEEWYLSEYSQSIFCTMDLPGDGCWPHSFEPPTNETCKCWCTF